MAYFDDTMITSVDITKRKPIEYSDEDTLNEF